MCQSGPMDERGAQSVGATPEPGAEASAAAGAAQAEPTIPSASGDKETAEAKAGSPDPGEPKGSTLSSAGEAGITVGLVTMLLFLRLFAVARWDWTVAASLAESFNFDDAVSIALGTLFERPMITGLIITVILPLAVFRDYWLASSKATKSRANNWFLIIALLVTAFVLTRTLGLWWIFACSAAIVIILVGGVHLAKRKGLGRDLARLGRHLGIVLGVLLLVVAATIETPWVEHEEIVTKEGVIDGYVLDSDPGFLKIMTQDREMIIVPDSDVVSRTLVD